MFKKEESLAQNKSKKGLIAVTGIVGVYLLGVGIALVWDRIEGWFEKRCEKAIEKKMNDPFREMY